MGTKFKKIRRKKRHGWCVMSAVARSDLTGVAFVFALRLRVSSSRLRRVRRTVTGSQAHWAEATAAVKSAPLHTGEGVCVFELLRLFPGLSREADSPHPPDLQPLTSLTINSITINTVSSVRPRYVFYPSCSHTCTAPSFVNNEKWLRS